jgi:hypothetical protein
MKTKHGANDMNEQNSIFASLRDKWPSTIVFRGKVNEFSGGVLNPRTLANLDSKGEGPKGRIRINGKRIAYTVESLIAFLEEHSEVVGE